MKLKSVTMYDVSVLLNNEAEMSCLLLTPPTVEALAAAAEETEAPREVTEALSFFREINLPAEDENEAITEITIAGTVAGSIRVVPLLAFQQPAKRGPKKKSADAKTPETPETPEE